ncbi:hypothetical protein L1049_013312 [Liquidambar formosana]|uniref:Protein kinase domain-containing protein n=1 Tax=Liquidambar formosana TaxID=63359 RepID=A0AAP0RLB4_LIQFO
MDLEDPNRTRLIGDYIVGARIGSGSFAVVWRATHRRSGRQVAVKEIDKKDLNPMVSEHLMREIDILRNINHPNIIRLFEAIQTADKIYLVLEYCDGGDLARYVHRDGKVSEAVARHFMRQLAAGLQVLNEKNLIHRDLKPQNLLLSTKETTPLLKIGDFGFARSLKPQGLADTLCGSPLYMAPEIIRSLKYDAKADLWSVGAILFQLVTGKPPFDGNSPLQLFQNITSRELQFPEGALEELHPDCVDLCRSLLRQNPVERLSFREFFNHQFLAEPKLVVDVEQSSLLPQIKSPVEQFECLTDEKLPSVSNKSPQLQSGDLLNPSDRNSNLTCSSVHADDDNKLHQKDHGSIKGVCEFLPSTACDKVRKSVDGDLSSSVQPRVADSMESIEKEYVLVNAHFASMEIFSSSLVTSLQENDAARVSVCLPDDQDIAAALQTKELTTSSVGGAEILLRRDSDPLPASYTSTILREVQGLSILHPSSRLQLLRQYVNTLSELVQEKFNADLFLESFSVELVVLALWKEVLRVCCTWLASTAENGASTAENGVSGSCSADEFIPVHEGASLSLNSIGNIDFCRPSSVSVWAEQGFLSAFDRAEKLSVRLRDMDG